MAYVPKVYKTDGGDKLVVASGGTIEVESGGTITLADGGLEAADVACADGKILVGNASAKATAVDMSGDATIANTGAVTIATGAVEDSMIEGLADGEFIIGVDGTAANNAKVTMSSHATLANDGALTLATVTKSCSVALSDLRCEDAAQTLLPATPDGDGGTLGLGAAAGSPVLGTSLNNTAASESCMFDFVVPADYVAASNIVVRLPALVTAALNAASNLDVVAKLIKAGALDATDLCLTSAIDIKDVTAEADHDYTLDSDASGDELAPGSVINIAITAAMDDTGGTAAGGVQLDGVEVRVPCYR